MPAPSTSQADPDALPLRARAATPEVGLDLTGLSVPDAEELVNRLAKLWEDPACDPLIAEASRGVRLALHEHVAATEIAAGIDEAAAAGKRWARLLRNAACDPAVPRAGLGDLSSPDEEELVGLLAQICEHPASPVTLARASEAVWRALDRQHLDVSTVAAAIDEAAAGGKPLRSDDLLTPGGRWARLPRAPEPDAPPGPVDGEIRVLPQTSPRPGPGDAPLEAVPSPEEEALVGRLEALGVDLASDPVLAGAVRLVLDHRVGAAEIEEAARAGKRWAELLEAARMAEPPSAGAAGSGSRRRPGPGAARRPAAPHAVPDAPVGPAPAAVEAGPGYAIVAKALEGLTGEALSVAQARDVASITNGLSEDQAGEVARTICSGRRPDMPGPRLGKAIAHARELASSPLVQALGRGPEDGDGAPAPVPVPGARGPTEAEAATWRPRVSSRRHRRRTGGPPPAGGAEGPQESPR